MISINPKTEKTSLVHAMMLGSIAPRPIAFVSTIDKNGIPNLSPFSFFNAFGAKPPIVAFSPARRVRDNTIKHTLENVREIGEVVINMVNYAMVQQSSLASCEYPKGVNEFEKAGFTQLASEIVKPYRVRESPVQMECIVKEVIETGHEGGAGNLVICEIVLMHISETILDEHGMIDPQKIDLVARMGADWYCRASGSSVFKVEKPNLHLGVGVDRIPANFRFSKILSGNDLGILGNIHELPIEEEVSEMKNSPEFKEIILISDALHREEKLHYYIKNLIGEGKVIDAWKVILLSNS